jgi:hypothetical protein
VRHSLFRQFYADLQLLLEPNYPQDLEALAVYIKQPRFPLALRQFIYSLENPDSEPPPAIDSCPPFKSKLNVYHSAIAIFYAPSDLCGAGGMKRERIRSTPSFHGYPRHDTVFVVLDDSQPGMGGMEIGRVLLLFSFHYCRKDYSCALINWFVHTDQPDDDTGMWVVELEADQGGIPNVQVIAVETIARAAHLLPIYGSNRVPNDFSHHEALDRYQTFFVNHFVDHHVHEFIVAH